MRAAELALEQAEYDLPSTIVRAPTLGVATNLHVGAGQCVTAGTSGVTFISGDTVRITADPRDNQLMNARSAVRTTLAFDALAGRAFEVMSSRWAEALTRAEPSRMACR